MVSVYIAKLVKQVKPQIKAYFSETKDSTTIGSQPGKIRAGVWIEQDKR